ncbi:inner membrane protein YfcA [Candidatus Vecturithrix granuli]|uniref:Probable membrane transporter protein n=1 Tax=Vecturithrix granuli TaxID=1499967 RepID=A0A081BVQ5_VECG1|nr:inner membrane protein YfcA [Candidatus Vecturithrix granuli]
MKSVLIFCIAFLATLTGSISGGSTSMVTIPIWLMFGVPLPVAVGSEKLNTSFWVGCAAYNYLRSRPIDWRLLTGLSLCGLFGVYWGTRVTISVNSEILKPCIGVILFLLVIFTALRPRLGVLSKPPTLGRLLTGVFGLPLGFYEGFFGSGNSIFTSIVLCQTRGHDLLQALGHYYILAWMWSVFAAIRYIHQGYYALWLVSASIPGAILGGYVGSRLGSKRGAVFVKRMFLVVGAIFSLKLLFGY